MTPFLVGVLETDQDEVFLVTETIGEFSDCGLGFRSFGEMCSIPLVETDLVPGSIMCSLVTQPLHLEILVTLFELV